MTNPVQRIMSLGLRTFCLGALLATASDALGQCGLGWSSGRSLAGIKAPVSAIAEDIDGTILVSGSFLAAGDVMASYAARFDPVSERWSPLGTGLPSAARKLIVTPQGDIFAADETDVFKLQRSTNTWLLVLDSNNAIEDLNHLADGRLVIGGDFTSINQTAASRIAVYNPVSGVVSALGVGLSGAVRDIAILPWDEIVVAGNFNFGVGSPTSYLAAFNSATNTWAPIDPPERATLRVEAMPDGRLALYGSGQSASGERGTQIAVMSLDRQTVIASPPLSASAHTYVNGLVVLADNSVAAHGYFNAALLPIAGIAVFSPETGLVSNAGWGSPANALIQSSNGDLYCGVSDSGYIGDTNIFRREGTTWAPLNEPRITLHGSRYQAETSGNFLCLTQFPLGNPAGSTEIARYVTTTGAYEQLSDLQALGGPVASFLLLPDGDYLVHGDFTHLRGVSTGGLARYRPSTGAITDLDPDPSHIFRDWVITPDGDVITIGRFDILNGLFTRGIVRLDLATNTWSTMGAGFVGSAYCMAQFPNGDLIVAGSFQNVNEQEISHITRYRATTDTWHPLGPEFGSGFIDDVFLLPDGDVLACGSFLSAAGVTSNYLARFDDATQSWNAFGSGANGRISYLAAGTFGSVIASGNFTSINGVPVSRIARLNPTTNGVQLLGSGMNGIVGPVASNAQGVMIATGSFSVAGPYPSDGIARYDPIAQRIAISHHPVDAQACPDGFAVFTVQASATPPPQFDWEWEREPGVWASIHEGLNSAPNGGGIIATDIWSASLSARPVPPLTQVLVRARPSNRCNFESSRTATLTLCIADTNCDGLTEFDDVTSFFETWDLGQPTADTDFDGDTDSDDIIVFFGAWESGC